MAVTQEQEDARLDDLAMRILHLLPVGWGRASLTYVAAGDAFEMLQLGAGMQSTRRTSPPIGRADSPSIRTGILPLLRRLREEMYEPGRGTWLGVRLTVRSGTRESRWGVTYRHADDARLRDELTPRDCAAELRRFPRADEHVSDWMRELAALDAAAVAFDPRPVRAAAQPESALIEQLEPGLEQLFMKARLQLRTWAPRGAGRLVIGRLYEGCWSVVRAEPAWLAVHFDGESCDQVVPYGSARDAVAHAMAGVMSDENVAVSSMMLSAAGLLSPRRDPRKGRSAWLLTKEGNGVRARTAQSPRPARSGAGDRDAYIDLRTVHNRPYEYFVCSPGPPPEEGGFLSVHDVFRRMAARYLPKPVEPARQPPPEPPTEVLGVGAEVDAYGDGRECFVYSIGTPYSRRGIPGMPGDRPYHVYRVVKPFSVSTGLFAPWPFESDEERARKERSGGWMGYYLGNSIDDYLAAGHLVEITGPGGEPIGDSTGDPS